MILDRMDVKNSRGRIATACAREELESCTQFKTEN